MRLSGWNARVHAYGVCDSPRYFYDYIDGLLGGLGASPDHVGAAAADLVRVVDAKGRGYAISADEELETVREVAMTTGVVLDPVYSGKAVASMLREMRSDPEGWAGRKVLFIHTGGLLGMYEKSQQLQPMVEALGRHERMPVP